MGPSRVAQRPAKRSINSRACVSRFFQWYGMQNYQEVSMQESLVDDAKAYGSQAVQKQCKSRNVCNCAVLTGS